jgi:hypothetical protein
MNELIIGSAGNCVIAGTRIDRLACWVLSLLVACLFFFLESIDPVCSMRDLTTPEKAQNVQRYIAAFFSLCICFSYLRFSDLRSNGFKLVFYLALCDILLNVQFIVFLPLQPYSSEALCQTQGVLMTFFINTGMFWTLVISLTMYSVIGDMEHKKPLLRRFVSSPMAYHTSVWGYCAFCALLPLFFDMYGGSEFDKGGGNCGFVYSNAKSKWFSVALMWVNIWGTMLATAVIAISLRGQLKNVILVTFEVHKAYGDTHGEDQGQASDATQALIEMHGQLKWYPIILLVGWALDSSFRFFQIATGDDFTNMPDWAIHIFFFASGCSLQAILNFVVYGFTPSVRRKWNNLFKEMQSSRSIWPLFQLEGSIGTTLRESLAVPTADEGFCRQSLRESVSKEFYKEARDGSSIELAKMEKGARKPSIQGTSA